MSQREEGDEAHDLVEEPLPPPKQLEEDVPGDEGDVPEETATEDVTPPDDDAGGEPDPVVPPSPA